MIHHQPPRLTLQQAQEARRYRMGDLGTFLVSCVPPETAEGGHRLVIPYDYGANDHGHSEAAIQLARKLGWTGVLVPGGLPDGSTAWVFDTADKVAI